MKGCFGDVSWKYQIPLLNLNTDLRKDPLTACDSVIEPFTVLLALLLNQPSLYSLR